MRKRTLLITGLVLVALLALSTAAWGGYFFEDPIYAIDGREVNVLIGRGTSEPVSEPTVVNFLVPRNVPARVVDSMGCVARITWIGAQGGPLRVSVAMVKAARTDAGNTYPVQVTVFDDDGYVWTSQGRAGAWVIVPYIKLAR